MVPAPKSTLQVSCPPHPLPSSPALFPFVLGLFFKELHVLLYEVREAFLIGSQLSLDYCRPIRGQRRAKSLREAGGGGSSGQSMFLRSSGPHGYLAPLLLVRVGEWMRVLRHQPALGNEKKQESPFLALGKAWPMFSTGKLKVKVLKEPK